jgi:hypothetical protein
VALTPKIKNPGRVIWNGEKFQPRQLAAEWQPKLANHHRRMQRSRKRGAIYDYLVEVYRFAHTFKTPKGCAIVGERMIKDQGAVVGGHHNCISLLIRATSNADRRTRWKWACCLAYAYNQRVNPDNLISFIKGLKGINGCVAVSSEA